jgi:hypothetical protein
VHLPLVDRKQQSQPSAISRFLRLVICRPSNGPGEKGPMNFRIRLRQEPCPVLPIRQSFKQEKG